MNALGTYLVGIFILALPLLAQNPRGVVSSHPRLWLNNSIPDTWDPTTFPGTGGQGRLAAVLSRTCAAGTGCASAGTSATAFSDFTQLVSVANSAGYGFTSVADENSISLLQAHALVYLIYHLKGDDTTANPHAQGLWDKFVSGNLLVTTALAPTSITTDSSGVATVNFSAPHGFLAGAKVGVQGVTDGGVYSASDCLNGYQTITAVPTSTSFTYTPHCAAPQSSTFTDSTLIVSSGATSQAYSNNAVGGNGVTLINLAYFYDWCYDWLVANGHDQEVRDTIKVWYWGTSPARPSSGFNVSIRDADYQNYTAWCETGIIQAGAALALDDPTGYDILNEGAGYLFEGQQVYNPEGVSSNQALYTFNRKISSQLLDGGALNEEGTQYWRNGANRFILALEAYDTATARTANIWVNDYPNTLQAGLYRIYTYIPGSPTPKMAPFANAKWSDYYNGRDNEALVMVNDRFPDGHLIWMIQNDQTDTWNPGAGGWTGLAYKLVYWPYVNGPTPHDPTDLPLAAKFGTDVVMRSGWGSNDTFVSFTGSVEGAYHRTPEAGRFDVWRSSLLTSGTNYLCSTCYPYFYQWQQRSASSNVVTVYDPNDCYRESTFGCGLDKNGRNATNDGGQRSFLRRINPPFTTWEWYILRSWSGTVYSDPAWSAIWPGVNPIHLPALGLGASYAHATLDATGAYATSYTGQGDNLAQKTAAAASSVTRDIALFQPQTIGGIPPIVVFDSVLSTDASYQKSWMIHTVGAPQVGPSWTTASAGINTTAASTFRADNQTARLYTQTLLPASTNYRTVGGNTCTQVAITGITSANPAVLTVPGHGLVAGEVVSPRLANDLYTPQFGGIEVANGNNELHVGTVIDADHISLVNQLGGNISSAGTATFAQVYTSGSGAPTGACTPNYVYYRTDVTPTELYTCGAGSTWVDKGQWTYGTGPVIAWHANCGYEGWVNQFGPAGSPGANLWSQFQAPSDEWNAVWKVDVQPSTSETQDYFLNVLYPTTTGVSSPPASTLISSASTYGAQITDGSNIYVAAFAKTPGVQSIQYTSTHTGSANHVVARLAPGTYQVQQGASTIATGLVAGADGSIAFNETGGGTFSVGGDPQLVVSPASLTYSCVATGANPANQTVSVSAVNTTLDNWSAAKTQTWLTLSPTSGVAAGSITASVSCSGLSIGNYSDTITVSSTTSGIINSPQTVSVSLAVAATPTITVTTSTVPDASWLQAYDTTLTAAGGTAPYTWTLASGSLPPGMSLTTAGHFSGTPTVTGTYLIGVVATDASSASSAPKVLSLTVDPPTPSIAVGGLGKIGGASH